MSRRGQVNLPSPSILDRAISAISPERGLARMKARTQLALAGQWLAGRTDRRPTMNWVPFGGSADADNQTDLRVMRGRTRDLSRNAPIALGAINTVVTSVAGTGLVLRSVIDHEALGMTEDEAQEWQRKTEREFRLWAEHPSACDATRTLDFYGLQALALRSALESGDVFATLPMINRRGFVYEMKVQLVEADRVGNKNWGMNTDRLCGGVELGDDGAPLRYHIMRRHPGGLMPMNMEWDTVAAFGSRTGRRNVIHLYDKLRPGQTRGVPYLAPVVESLKQLSDYTNAEISAAVISSMFTVFVKTEAGGGLDTGDGSIPQTAPAGSNLQMGSGAILDLAPGEDVTFADPKRPNTAFDPFVLSVLRQIGVALQLPFEILVKHFTASYSAARAALLEAWRFYKGRRAWLALQFCQPIYEAWMEEAVARGTIEAPGFFDDPRIRAAYLGSEWIGDSPGQIDPQKEVDAQKGLLELNLTTHTDACTTLTGADWESVVQRRAREERRLRELGLVDKFSPLTPANINNPQQQDRGGDQGDTEGPDAPAEEDAPDSETARGSG